MPTEKKLKPSLPEVKRWQLKGFIPGVEGESKAVFRPVMVLADDFDRIAAERDALQLLLNDRDEQLHTLEQSRRSHFDNAQAAERRIDLLESALREIVHNYNHGHLQHTHKAIVAAEELIEPAETEPDQGIPGTSFQRLNMLANQGE
jgi:dsDNA-specific endonuclease/ATPase MutS2